MAEQAPISLVLILSGSLNAPSAPSPPSKTNSITMDLFSLIDSIVYYPSTTPEEEGIPVEFETGGNTGVGCVIV